MKFPGSIKVKCETAGLPVSYFTAVMVKATPEKTVAHLNKLAVASKLHTTYTLATDEQYWAYRDELRAAIAG
jgi:hypothetical protein